MSGEPRLNLYTIHDPVTDSYYRVNARSHGEAVSIFCAAAGREEIKDVAVEEAEAPDRDEDRT